MGTSQGCSYNPTRDETREVRVRARIRIRVITHTLTDAHRYL